MTNINFTKEEDELIALIEDAVIAGKNKMDIILDILLIINHFILTNLIMNWLKIINGILMKMDM